MHELAFGVTSDNYYFGSVKNPVDPTLIAGGSSGGSAAVVAAGIVKIALGTDTGGSCRIPASLCGVYGFRPTSKRYSSEGVVPLALTRDTIGLLGDNLEDIKLFDGIITSGNANDTSTPISFRKLYRFTNKLRLGVSKHYFFSSMSNEVRIGVESVLATLSANDKIELVYEDMIGKVIESRKYHWDMYVHEVSTDLPKFLDEYKTGVSIEKLIDEIASPDVKTLLKESRKKFLAGETETPYRESLKERIYIKDSYEAFLDEHKLDAMMYPTTPIEAKTIKECDPNNVQDGKQAPTVQTYFHNTDPGAYAGIPSISLPLAKTSKGLPIGIQLETFENHDRQLFEIARIVRDAVI